MQEPCQYLTPYQQIEYYNRKSIWRLAYQLADRWSGTTPRGWYVYFAKPNHMSGNKPLTPH